MVDNVLDNVNVQRVRLGDVQREEVIFVVDHVMKGWVEIEHLEAVKSRYLSPVLLLGGGWR